MSMPRTSIVREPLGTTDQNGRFEIRTSRSANIASVGGRLALRPCTIPFFLLTLMLTTLPTWAAAGGGTPSRSTSIALVRGGHLLLNVNHEANSVTLFEVRGGKDGLKKLVEIPVQREPTCVAVHPDGERAFVTNSASGTVSVIALEREKSKVIKNIVVGTEPEGCALTPSGEQLFVANLTEGTVAIVDTDAKKLRAKVEVGGRPAAIAITNNGNSNDRDETVFVTEFYAELIPNGPGEGFDNGKQGVVHAFRVGDYSNIKKITLSPLDSGFTADRTNFCQQLNPAAVNNTYCPDTTILDKTNPKIAKDPQTVFPNQLNSALVCGNRLYLPNVGAQPEPPVLFNANVQGLVHVVDTGMLKEVTNLHVNLNAQVKTETPPANPIGTLQRAFLNDVIAIDADKDCRTFLIVSRGGSYVMRAHLVGDKLNIGAPDKVVRFATGNIPTGVVIDGPRAFVNNQVNQSVSVLDLGNNTVVARDISSSTPPTPGSHAHAVQLGQLVFFTALGVPDNGLIGTELRDIDTVQFRGKQSVDAWSTCASCHPRGLSDGVTWIFADGPRQAIPLDGLYSKINGPHDIRINNWSAARDSTTDFNNNSRNVQCGTGFAGGATNTAVNVNQCAAFGVGVPNPAIFDHGVSQGGSEALDFEAEWAMTVRPLNMPKPDDQNVLSPGATVFEGNCASCHGGAKWTKSQVIYANNPALDKDATAGGKFRDPGVTNGVFRDPAVKNNDPDQVISYQDAKLDKGTLKFLEDIGTFDVNNPIEIIGQTTPGTGSLGALGFNVPSVLSTAFHAPFFHNGAAQTLEEVFKLHKLGGGTIQTTLGDGDRANLLVFLNALDGRTGIFTSETDTFKDPTK